MQKLQKYQPPMLDHEGSVFACSGMTIYPCTCPFFPLHPVFRLVKDQTALTQGIDSPGLVRVLWMASRHSCDFWIDDFRLGSLYFVRFSRSLESVDDKQVWGSCRVFFMSGCEFFLSFFFLLFCVFFLALRTTHDLSMGGWVRLFILFFIHS